VFLPILTSLGAPFCYVGRSIPLLAIESWKREEFGYKDPARSVPLGELVAKQFALNDKRVRAELESASEQAASRGSLYAVFARRTVFLELARERDLQLRNLSRSQIHKELSLLMRNARLDPDG
jgi:hypothetical protein